MVGMESEETLTLSLTLTLTLALTLPRWAVGVLLFELLMGRPPFEGETSTETLSKVLG